MDEPREHLTDTELWDWLEKKRHSLLCYLPEAEGKPWRWQVPDCTITHDPRSAVERVYYEMTDAMPGPISGYNR